MLSAVLFLSAAGLARAAAPPTEPLGRGSAASSSVGERLTEEQLRARYYYDLGPAEVDVASYPEPARRGYRLFQMVCTQCHGAARPLNSPIASRADWRRYVARMSGKDRRRIGVGLSRDEAAAIVDFLAHDSRVRKVEGREAFAARTAGLKSLFEEVRRERARRAREEDARKARRREQGRPPGAP